MSVQHHNRPDPESETHFLKSKLWILFEQEKMHGHYHQKVSICIKDYIISSDPQPILPQMTFNKYTGK